MNTLTSFGIGGTPTQSVGNFPAPAQRITLADQTNPKFIRAIILTDSGVILMRPGQQVGIPMTELLHALITANPLLTWPPVITAQPANMTVAAPNPASFSVTATSELTTSITYQWQISSDNGATWSDLTNTGVYSNVTTYGLAISSVTGLSGKRYRCNLNTVVNGTPVGPTTSNGAILTVT